MEFSKNVDKEVRTEIYTLVPIGNMTKDMVTDVKYFKEEGFEMANGYLGQFGLGITEETYNNVVGE